MQKKKKKCKITLIYNQYHPKHIFHLYGLAVLRFWNTWKKKMFDIASRSQPCSYIIIKMRIIYNYMRTSIVRLV